MILNEVHESSVEANAEKLREQVKTEIRQNYDFGLFSILPGLDPDFAVLMKSARKMGIEAAMAERWAGLLMRAGLWKLDHGSITSNFELLDLGDISVKDYLSMTITLISRLSDDKSYAYDTLSVVTNRQLIREFVQKVNGALKTLHAQSQAPGVEKTVVFSWSHTGVIEFEKKKLLNKDSDEG